MREHFTQERTLALEEELSALGAKEVIRWATDRFGDRLTFACSFGAEDVVILDMLLEIDPRSHVFVLDTGRLHQQTHDLIEEARRRWRRSFDFYLPDQAALEALLGEGGPNGFYMSAEARKACCRVRKINPLARALAGRSAWLTGLRKEQSLTREKLRVAELDHANGGLLKLNPLVDWTEEEVWDHIRDKKLPYNVLHDRGYPSIGCAPCTRPVRRTENIRTGRWWWEEPERRECGLHPGQSPVAAEEI